MHVAATGTKIHSTENNKKQHFRGTVYYAAPEVLTSLRGGTDSFSVVQYFFAYILKVRICLILSDFCKIMILTSNTVFPRIIAGGNYFFFCTKRGRLLDGGDYLNYCSLEVVPSILCYIFLLTHSPLNRP